MRFKVILLCGFFAALSMAYAGPAFSAGEQVAPLFDPGTEEVVDYAKYGEFKGLGTDNYKYEIKDRKGLAAAVGEGIYPSTSITKDPAYREAQASGKLIGKHWEFVNNEDQMLAFYKWATASEESGVKQYYTAAALARSGHTLQAIKAHYAVLVNYPRSIGWTYWHTPLYTSKMALNDLEYLIRTTRSWALNW
ncbi:MAG: hypothetical protein WC317_08280 [Candidatus Omnitrophota bacterium]|jgi:hypothetical protein